MKLKLNETDMQLIKYAIISANGNLKKAEVQISTGNNVLVYRCGTIIRIDIKGVFDDSEN